jgi:putative transposase
MPDYRRQKIPGGTFFFTVVTFRRRPILTIPASRRLLRAAWLDVRERFPFITEAVCLLPDHLHCIWTLPEGEVDYSLRWKEIKRLFTKGYLSEIGAGDRRNASRLKRGEAAIWQRRFWEHVIRDQEDLNRHLDYLHYNPVKHGLVERVCEWPWSSFHRYVRREWYPPDWGGDIDPGLKDRAYGE